MSPHSPAGETGTTDSRCRSLHVRIPMMTLLCQVGSAIHHAVNITVHKCWQIQRESGATRTVTLSGPMLEMAISAVPLEAIMAEGLAMLLKTSLGVKVPLIRVTIVLNSDARIMIGLLIQNVLQAIQTTSAAHADTTEVVLVHTCMGRIPHATKLFKTV